MKRKLIFLLLLLISSVKAWSGEEITIGNLTYNIESFSGETDYYATVICNDKSIKEAIIPPTINYNKSIVPVYYIGIKAFSDCTNLERVIIGSNVLQIREEAFKGCTNLSSIVILSSVRWISRNAFDGCTGLKSVQISSLSSWCNIGFFNKNSNPLTFAHHLYLNDIEVTEVVIPNTVIHLEPYTFSGLTGLKSVTIPNSVTMIEDSVFLGCEGLTKVFIPSSVTNISPEALNGCPNLVEIKVDENNPKYDSRDNCNAIIQSETNALMIGCNHTIIPNSVSIIKENAFMDCLGIKELVIPHSITSIENGAFTGCSNLESLVINCSTIKNWFKDVQKSIKQITLGESVSKLENYAFQNCTGLSNITIKNSIPDINQLAFSGCI